MNGKTASQILKGITGNDAALKALILEERINLECASMIYNARKRRGLTQAQLAKLVGTSQSAIARLEDADYGGRTLQLMYRIAAALGLEYVHSFTEAPAPAPVTVRYEVKECAPLAAHSSREECAAINNYAYAA